MKKTLLAMILTGMIMFGGCAVNYHSKNGWDKQKNIEKSSYYISRDCYKRYRK